jgi:asparagine synthase (glutamine-hydrolysing)
MYFLSKAISDLGIKVVLSGKGLMRFGGYLYFRNAPSAVEFQKLLKEFRNYLLLIC